MFTQHPEILDRTREEVIEALGPDGTPTLEDIRKLKYRALLVSEDQMKPSLNLLRSSPGCT